MGFALEQGYISIFGISREYLPREFSELWAHSFYVVLYAISLFIPRYWMPIVFVFIFFLAVYLLALIFVGIFKFFERKDISLNSNFKNKYLKFAADMFLSLVL
jgi:hypothetical protein